MRDGQRMRRQEQSTEALARAVGQAMGYLGLTAAVVWLLLRLA